MLDASDLHGGRRDTGKVQRLAVELAVRGAELWIPEVVVFELAVHAWEDLTSNRQTHKRLRQAGLALGQELLDLDSAQITTELLKACAAIPNVVIIEMTGESAVAGLRDQILGTGPGTVDHGVRTGASDSSWVRDLFDRASGDPRAIVFLSRNVKDVVAVARALGHDDSDVQIWKRTGAVAEEKMLNKFFGAPPESPAPVVPIDEITVLGVITAPLRRDHADTKADDDRHGPPREWIEINDISIGVNHDWAEDAEVETMIDPEPEVDAYVRLVDVMVISLRATNDDGTGVTVDYVVRRLADVRVEGQKIDNDGNS
ncbi:hypothetical protein A5653_17565 [Mycobacterium colombiense]|uniref:hypothetical protein n=1 Tax=Mycobacterium colombiense TaxID=339268 RepID=UPI0007EEF730|nr:hypothetical protein [Mycobacterium colombiense]OBK67141.1 hypothetical protein A5653_17565 [Mycobacterium colombiense]